MADDVHQVVVIEMLMETNAALLHARRGDRDENPRCDVGASAQPSGAAEINSTYSRMGNVIDSPYMTKRRNSSWPSIHAVDAGNSRAAAPISQRRSCPDERRGECRGKQEETGHSHGERGPRPERRRDRDAEHVLKTVVGPAEVAGQCGPNQCTSHNRTHCCLQRAVLLHKQDRTRLREGPQDVVRDERHRLEIVISSPQTRWFDTGPVVDVTFNPD